VKQLSRNTVVVGRLEMIKLLFEEYVFVFESNNTAHIGYTVTQKKQAMLLGYCSNLVYRQPIFIVTCTL